MNTMKELLDHAADSYGDYDSVQYIENEGNVIHKSYRNLREDSEKVAGYLQFLGYRREKIAIVSPNSYEWMVAFFGIILSGNIVIPIDHRLPMDNIHEILKKAEVRVCIYHKKLKGLADKIRVEVASIEALLCINDYGVLAEKVPENGITEYDADGEACCMIMFTSGTTGASKGVMLSQKGLLVDAESASSQSDNRHKVTHVVSILPMFHIFALAVDILWSVVQGFTLYLANTIPEVVQYSKTFGATRICMVPMMADYIYHCLVSFATKHPEMPRRKAAEEILGEKIHYLVFGGAYLEPEFRKNLMEFGLEIRCGYGMTETSCVIATEEGVEGKSGSVGRILDCNEVKIVDGEIWVRGENIMLGYYQDDDSTQEILKDGWIMTGDIGYVDEEHYLFIVGKKKNVIITASGENISPEELEKKLLAYDMIKETIVYQKKNQIIAEIYPDYEKTALDKDEQNQHMQKIIDEINAANPAYKHIQGWTIRDTEFEKTGTMKIKRENYYYQSHS